MKQTNSIFSVLFTRRFAPFFAAQFLGAFNDNVFRNALLVLMTYTYAAQLGEARYTLVSAAMGVFILPFFLFSALAGQVADKFPKDGVIRWVKFMEITIMALGALGLWLASPYFLLCVLFLMGTQSAFFGPLKYAVLPEYLKKEELIAGNGIVSAGTFLAILSGTFLGAELAAGTYAADKTAFTLICAAFLGWLASRWLLPTKAAAPKETLRWNIFSETFTLMRYAVSLRTVFPVMLGISWFWMMGATFLSQFTVFTKDIIGGDEGTVIVFLLAFTIGIGVGSILCARILKGKPSPRLAFWAAVLMSLCVLDGVMTGYAYNTPETLISRAEFFDSPERVRMFFDFMGLALGGGLYIVPLMTLLQTRTSTKHRARAIAANNILNALAMVLSSVLVILLYRIGWGVLSIFAALAFLNIPAAWWVKKKMGREG